MSMYYGVWYRIAPSDESRLRDFLEKVVGEPFERYNREDIVTAVGPSFSWDLVQTDPELDDDELHLGDYPLALKIRPRHAHTDSELASTEARRIFESSRSLGVEAMLLWDLEEVLDRINAP